LEQASVIRAAIVVAIAALLDAVVVPYLTFGFFSPRLTLIAIVFAVAPLRDLQAVLLGFFGGILLDALGSDLFGVGALGGLLTATLASRASAVRRRGSEKVLLAQVAGLAVAASVTAPAGSPGWEYRSSANMPSAGCSLTPSSTPCSPSSSAGGSSTS
jgi:rod shape-determining protein MreD